MYFLLKVLISALIIALVSEVGKRSSFVGAILASLPLTSLLAMIWLYHDTRDTAKIADLSHGIFFMVIPSLAFFLILPLLLRSGMGFPWAMLASSASTFLIYLAFVFALGKFGVSL